MPGIPKSEYLLDPSVVFLNHGSFGACPRVVFEAYQDYQLELERQPVLFLGRLNDYKRDDGLIDGARRMLAEYLHADADCVAFTTNATMGVNMVARSLVLKPGDEILTTDHEYGACDHTWQYVCDRAGARYVHHPIPRPIAFTDAEAFTDHLWQGVTDRTRAIFLSHVTSRTALIFPIERVIRRAREQGILTIIDGAHAPNFLPLDLDALGADFYAANLHKWLSAPKGAGFLYARREHHPWIVPNTISWGGTAPDETFVRRTSWQGTRDLAPFLAVQDAIAFWGDRDADAIRESCRALAIEAANAIDAITKLVPLAPRHLVGGHRWLGQMIACALPPCDPDRVKARLYDEFRVEVPITVWHDRAFVRVSIAPYNMPDDVEQLVTALKTIPSSET